VGVRFSVPMQTDLKAHPASGTMGTGSFQGVMWLGHSADHPHPSSAKVVNGFELYLCLPSVPA
jgi:hypothetical protein